MDDSRFCCQITLECLKVFFRDGYADLPGLAEPFAEPVKPKMTTPRN